MESLSSMDEGDQQVATTLVLMYLCCFLQSSGTPQHGTCTAVFMLNQTGFIQHHFQLYSILLHL